MTSPRRFPMPLFVVLAAFFAACAPNDTSAVNGPKNSLARKDNKDQTSVREQAGVAQDLQIKDIEILSVKLRPFKTATGLETKMVYIDWKNNGSRPVRVLDARIIGVDQRGGRTDIAVPDYTIYATSNTKPGIKPGEVYTEPEGEGFVISSYDAPSIVRAIITITKVKEKSRF